MLHRFTCKHISTVTDKVFISGLLLECNTPAFSALMASIHTTLSTTSHTYCWSIKKVKALYRSADNNVYLLSQEHGAGIREEPVCDIINGSFRTLIECWVAL